MGRRPSIPKMPFVCTPPVTNLFMAVNRNTLYQSSNVAPRLEVKSENLLTRPLSISDDKVYKFTKNKQPREINGLNFFIKLKRENQMCLWASQNTRFYLFTRITGSILTRLSLIRLCLGIQFMECPFLTKRTKSWPLQQTTKTPFLITKMPIREVHHKPLMRKINKVNTCENPVIIIIKNEDFLPVPSRQDPQNRNKK